MFTWFKDIYPCEFRDLDLRLMFSQNDLVFVCSFLFCFACLVIFLFCFVLFCFCLLLFGWEYVGVFVFFFFFFFFYSWNCSTLTSLITYRPRLSLFFVCVSSFLIWLMYFVWRYVRFCFLFCFVLFCFFISFVCVECELYLVMTGLSFPLRLWSRNLLVMLWLFY